MKSAFTQKITNYYSLKENAMFTRIKLGAWTFIVFSIMMIIATLSYDNSLSIPVRPISFHYYDSSIATYGENNIKLTGKLEITNPTIVQELLMPVSFVEFDVMNCLLVIIISILLLRLLPHIHSTVLFQTDISNKIRSIGISLLIFWIIDLLRIFFYVIPEISRITNEQFFYQKNGFMFIPIPFWSGIVLLWIGKIYKNAFHLKQEQELTI